MKTSVEALVRMRAIMGTGAYRLGGTRLPQPDPANPGHFLPGWETDCIGAVLWAYDIERHRPGFNRGPWATVSDDINTDSACQDAAHLRELFIPLDVSSLEEGDLVIYPSDHGSGVPWGHVGMLSKVEEVWYPGRPKLYRLRLLQCHGPKGTPMVVETGDDVFRLHTEKHPHNPSRYLRVKGA